MTHRFFRIIRGRLRTCILLLSLVSAVDANRMSVSTGNVVGRYGDAWTLRHSKHQVPQWLSSRAARSRQFRRAFRHSLVQIFGMKTQSERLQATRGGGVRHVPAYMRWLYEESSAGRLPAVLRRFHQRTRDASTSRYRQKRHHSPVTANTVRSFTGTYAI